MSRLADVGFAVSAGAGIERVLSLIARGVTELPGVLYGGVYLLDADGRTLVLRGWHGLTAEYLKIMADAPLDLGTGTAATGPPNVRAVLTGTTVVVPNVFAEPELARWMPVFRPQGFRGIAAVPLIDADGAAVGSLTAYLADGTTLAAAELGFLEQSGQDAAAAVALVFGRDRQRAAAGALRAEVASLTDRVQLLLRLGAVQHEALRLSAAEAGLDAVMRQFADGLGVSLAVTGPDGRTVAAAHPGQAPVPGQRPVSSQPRSPEAEDADACGAGPGYTCELRGYEGQVMTLHAQAASGTRLDEFTRRSLDGAALVIDLELGRLGRDAEIGARLASDLVADLLSPAAMRYQEAVLGRAAALGHQPHQAHDILIVAVLGDEGSAAQLRQFSRQITDLARPLSLRPVVGTVGSQVVVLNPVPGADTGPRPGAATRSLAGQIARSVTAQVRVLIGPQAASLAEAQHSIDVASRAARFLTPRSPGVVDMAAFGFYGLVLQSAVVDSLREMAEHTLGPLLRYDAQKKTDLLLTLRAWLAADMAAPAVADAMFVHVNTVNYRLRRIGEITGLQPSRPADLVQLQMALAIAEVAGTVPPLDPPPLDESGPSR